MTSSIDIPVPPSGWQRLAWLGPGFLWMVSAAGSGELLFTPRIGSLYGYTLLWALLGAIAMKWVINREVGRLAVCTGRPVLHALRDVPGPRNWALWVILVPQLVVAVATIAGLASAAASGIRLLLPAPMSVWTVVLIAASAALVLVGRYRLIERVAMVLAISIAVAAIVAATSVVDEPGVIAAGLVPHVPADVDLQEVLPWLGFALSGAAGMMWYSYWLTARGYGAASSGDTDGGAVTRTPEAVERLRGWSRQMTLDNTVAVVGTTLIMVAFLVLGAELLGPAGLVPSEERTASVIGELLGRIWGPIGYWWMVVTVIVGFASTVLSDQDGFARMFVDGTRSLLGRVGAKLSDVALRRVLVIGVLAVAPAALFLIVGKPVALLQLAGSIEAAHLPVLAWLVVHQSRRRLDPALRPSLVSVAAAVLAGLFFAAFAVLYVAGLVA